MNVHKVILTHDLFDAGDALAQFTADAAGDGAIVSFTGLARDKNHDGRFVTALVLETYRGVTLASMEEIAQDARARFAISRSLVMHRAGEIKPGEAIVFVATASAHRRAAFEAADYMMDRLKTEAIFWKKEITPDGAAWIEPRAADHDDRERWT